jgi:uncharacterized protein (TIGR03437 family)
MRFRILLAVLALVICTGTIQASGNLLTPTLTVTSALKCDTNTGPAGSATVKITAASATASNIITVSLGTLPAGITVTLSAGAVALNSATASATYTVTATAGCAGTTLGTYAPTLPFKAAVGAGAASADATQALSIAVTAGATSPLVASPSSVTISCTKNLDGSYTGGSQNFNVTSTATGGGTPVAVNASSIPGWLTITPPGTPVAGTSPITFGASVANSACSGAVGSSKSANLQLLNAPATAYQTLKVTLQVVGPSQLTLSPASAGVSTTPVTVSYTKNQTSVASTTVTVKGANLYFGVDTTSLPNWLTVNFTSGQANNSAGFPLVFTVTKVADSLTPGVYPSASTPAAIRLNVAGYADTVVYISLSVQNTAATLSVAEGMARNLMWSVGQPLPSATITAVSSGSPIPFTTTLLNPTTNGANPSVSPSSGLAYSFGTAISVTFDPLAFAGAQPGSTLTGSVQLNWSGSPVVVVFNISIQAPSTRASLTGMTPSNLPSAPAGSTFAVTLYGSGFVSSTDPTQQTTVGVASGTLKTDANIAVTVVNASTINLIITVPPVTPADPLLPFGTPNSPVVIGVCNPSGSSCNSATASLTLTIGAGPTIQSGGVTSASTFAPVTPVTGTLAPYDIISLFGSNFCTSNGSGCTNGQVLYAPLTSSLVYGSSLTPDAGQRNLQVFFYNTGQTTTGPGAAPLLFATNNQINLVVPGGLTTGNKYDIIVKFGNLSSTPFTFTAADNDIGVFPVDANSPAQGAIILANGAVATNANAARMRANAGDSDIVSVFITGFGIPSSASANTSGGGSTPAADCVSPANYKASAGLGTLDGAIIQSAVITPGRLVPCFDPAGYTATVGQASGTVKYVGWAPDAIAGLYQVNIQLPDKSQTLKDPTGATISSFTGPAQVLVAVTITSGSKTSQGNIAMWVQPGQTLKATATPVSGVYPVAVGSLTNAGTTAVALDTVTATGGTGPTYAVTAVTGTDSGGVALLADFAVDTSGAVTIKRAFLAGTYSVTITATDTGSPALPAEAITLTFTVS